MIIKTKTYLLLCLLSVSLSVQAQHIFNAQGAKINIQQNTKMVLSNTSWVNDGAELLGDSGTVAFTGSQTDSIGGNISTTFGRLLIDKTTGEVQLTKSAAITDSLELKQGLFVLENQDIALQATANCSEGNASSYIQTLGTGALKQEVTSSQKIFPIGGSNYRPIWLTNVGTADLFAGRVTDSVLSQGTTGTRLDTAGVHATWFVAEQTAGGSDLDVQLQWNANDELSEFDRSNCYIAAFDSLWDVRTAGASLGAGPYLQTRSGITNASAFTLFNDHYPFDVTTHVSEACVSSPTGLVLDAFGAARYRLYSRSHNSNVYVSSGINSFPTVVSADALAYDVVSFPISSSSEDVTYTLAPIGRDGIEGDLQQVVISVNPSPSSVSGMYSVACTGVRLQIDLALGQTPAAGVTYSWEAALPLPANISIVAGNNAGSTHIIDDVITNSSSAPIFVPYYFQLSNGSCTSTSYVVYVVVLPSSFCGVRLAEKTQLMPYFPIELTANRPHAHDVQLRWNQHTSPVPLTYVVEKKRNDGVFEQIATVDARQEADHYAFLDKSGMSNENLYRVKLIFANGQRGYSNEVDMNFDFVDGRLSLYPNPTSGRFTLHAPAGLAGEWSYQLSDGVGKVLQVGFLQAKENKFDISKLSAGYYFLVISSPSGKRYLKKVIKN